VIDVKFTGTYDSNWNIDTLLIERWDGSALVNYMRLTYIYDSNGNNTEGYSEFWYGSVWITTGRGTLTYDSNGNLILELSEKWNGVSWENNERKTYVYDYSGSNLRKNSANKSIGNMISATCEEWDDGAWKAKDGSLEFYDSFGREFSWDCSGIEAYYSSITNILEPNTTVFEYSLSQNYPNPFNPTTVINYQLSVSSNVNLVVYNSLGQKVQTLVNLRQDAGIHIVTFNGDDLSSGIYFYKLTAGSFTQIRKMILIR